MRNLLFFLLIVQCFAVKAQSIHPEIVEDTLNIYYSSLKTHLLYINRFHTNEKDRVIYIKEDNATTDKLPLKIGDFSVQFLNDNDIIEKAKANGKIFFDLIIVNGVKIKGDSLIVRIQDSRVNRPKKKVTSFAYGSGGTYIFKYDCHDHCFNMVKNYYWGI